MWGGVEVETRREEDMGEFWSKILCKYRIKDKEILSTATTHSVVEEEGVGDHLLQPLYFAAEELRPGEKDQDHTAGEESGGPVMQVS